MKPGLGARRLARWLPWLVLAAFLSLAASRPAAELAGHLKRNCIGHLALTPSEIFAESLRLEELVAVLRVNRPGSLQQVWRAEPGYVIYRVDLQSLQEAPGNPRR